MENERKGFALTRDLAKRLVTAMMVKDRVRLVILILSFEASLSGASRARAETNPTTTQPATGATTLPSIDSALVPIRPGVVLSINGSDKAESRQGWPLLIVLKIPRTMPSTTPPHVEIIANDGKPVAWTLKSLPASPGRFTWAVSPEQTQSTAAGAYTVTIRLGDGPGAKSATAKLTLIASTMALTPAQQDEAPFVLAAYYLRTGDTAAAKKCLDDGIKADPQHVGLLILRGDVLMAAGEFSDAAAAYANAMDVRAKLVNDDDDPPVQLMAKWSKAIRKANAGKELLNEASK